eukprot:g364.t1
MDDRISVHYKALACGDKHTLLLNDDGRTIYAFGCGKYGQLGNGQSLDVIDNIVTVDSGVSNDQHLAWSEGQSYIKHISCGANHSAALSDSGRLYTWGRQHKCQLGHTDTWGAVVRSKDSSRKRSKEIPCVVKRLLGTKIVYVSCGADFTLAVDKKRDLWSWGLGSYGNLGHGDTLNKAEPQIVQVMRGRTLVAKAGAKHAIALAIGGSVFTWGHGDNGRLGLDIEGKSRDRGYPAPKIIPRLNDIIDIACGEAHSAAINRSGNLFTWGAGTYGRLGHGTEGDQNVAKCVESISSQSVIGMDCGAFHTMVIIDANDRGMLMGFGDNQYGQLGIGMSVTTQDIPREIGSLGGASVTEVACGQYHTLVVAHDSRFGGRIYSFGFGGNGRLGKTGCTDTIQKLPRRITNIEPIGGSKIDQKSAVRRSDMGGDKCVISVDVGAQHSLAVSENGTAWGWGDNEYGQTGVVDESGTSSLMVVHEPRQIKYLSRYRIEKVACGSDFSLALTRNGDVYAWGRSEDFQLGTGSGGRSSESAFQRTPVVIQALQDLAVVDIAAGEDHAAAILSSGALYMWGSSDAGKLGYSGTGLLPRRVGGALLKESVLSVSLGMAHTAVVTKSHRLYTWGGGWFGRLGHGDKKNVYTPTLVMGHLRGRLVTAVSCGAYHTLAVCDGDLFAWGRNEGRLGIKHVAEQLIPMRNEFLRHEGTVVVGVSAGEDMSLVFDKFGAVWAWGKATNGKLGVGSFDVRISDVPMRVKQTSAFRATADLFLGTRSGVSDRRKVCVNSNHCASLTSDGRLYMWGCSRSGRTTHNQDTNAAKIVSALSSEKGRGGDREDSAGDSGATKSEQGGGGDDGADRGGATKDDESGSAVDGEISAARSGADERREMVAKLDQIHDWRQLAVLGQKWAREEGNEDQRDLEKLQATCKEDYAKMHASIYESQKIRNVIRFQETRIGLLLESTLHSMNGGPPTVDKRTSVPEHIAANKHLYAHLIAMLRAHPCYLDTIYDHVFGSEQDSWSNVGAGKDTKGRAVVVDDDRTLRIRDKNSFKDLVLAVFGDLSVRANEHLFLATLQRICIRQFKHASTRDDGDNETTTTGVFEKLVEDYFKSPHLSLQITKQLNSLLDELYKPGDGGNIALITNPCEIENQDGGGGNEAGGDQLARAKRLYQEKQVIKEKVDNLVTTLRRICNSWFNQLNRLVKMLTTTVKFVCNLRAEVFETSGSGELGQSKVSERTLRHKISTFLINFLIKPALKKIELSRTRKPSRKQIRNRKKVLTVLYRIIANKQYSPTRQPWLRPINQLIANKQRESAAMIQSLRDVPPNFLQMELKVDLYKAPLRMSSLVVQNIKVKDIIYLRDALDFCQEQLAPHRHLHRTVMDLLGKPEVKESMVNGSDGEFLNRRMNLRVDTCLWHELKKPGSKAEVFGFCNACKVPLVSKLLPLSRIPLEDVPELPPKPTEEETSLVFCLKKMDDLSKRGSGRQLTKTRVENEIMLLSRDAEKFSREGELSMYRVVLGKLKKSENLTTLFRKACNTTGQRYLKRDSVAQAMAKQREVSIAITKYTQVMMRKRIALNRFLKICREGQEGESNRQMIKKYAPSRSNLSSDNFIAEQQGASSTDSLKKALKRMKACVGQHCEVSFADMKACGAVTNIMCKSELQLSRSKLESGTSFHIDMMGATISLRMIYASSLILYSIHFTLQDLTSRLKQNVRQFSPLDARSDTEYLGGSAEKCFIRAEFDVENLIEMIKRKLVLPDLLGF